MAEWIKASVLKTDSGYKLLVGSNPTLSDKETKENMKKYKKKATYSKIETIFKSDKNIIIGQFDNTRTDIWKELKETYDFWIPQNKLCQFFCRWQTKYSTKIPKIEATIFEGPIFCLSVETDLSFSNVLGKMNQVKIPLYGGVFKGKFYDFADIQEIEYLLRKKETNKDHREKGCLTLLGYSFLAQKDLCFMNPFFQFQNRIKNAIKSPK